MAGFFDDIVAQQNGGGMLGGLPATWQYQNPETLTPKEKEMMALAGTQNPEQAGFNPLAAAPGAFPAGGAAPIAGANSPFGMLPSPSAPAPVADSAMATQPGALRVQWPPPPVSPPPAMAEAPPVAPPISSDNSAPQIAPSPPIPTFGAAPPVPTFGAGASPIFAAPPGSPGTPAMPSMNAPARLAAAPPGEEDDPSASPIAVGKYKMPRIGSAEDFAPDPAALPVNAQAAQGQGSPGPAAAAAPSIGDKLMTGYQNLHHGGGLIGSIVAAVTGKRNDPTGVATQQAADVGNMTARALIAKNVDPSVAFAAVQPGNGEMLKTLIAHAFGPQTVQALGSGYIADKNGKVSRAYEPDEKFQHVTHKNNDGSESLLTFDPSTGKYTAAPNTGSLRAAVDPESTGPERMAALTKADPNYARKIQAMVNGDVPMPTAGQAARSPQAQRMIEDVLAVDGSTSSSDFATRAATRKDYASGMASRVTKSLNTTIEHAQRLDESIDKLGNHTWVPGITNWLHDKSAGNWSPEYQKARSEFESNKEAFIKELDFTLSGGHSSVSGSAELRDKINRADSPEALHAAIKADLHLLSARLDSHTTGFNQGTRSQRDGQDFLYPKNRAAFNNLMGSKDTSTGGAVPGVDNAPAMSSAAPGAPVTPPAPGAYVWSPDKGLAPK